MTRSLQRGVLLGAALLVACGGSTATPAPDPAPVEPTPAPVEAADPAAPAPDPAAEGDEPSAPTTAPTTETPTADMATVCGRARACCEAYVAALPSPRRPLEARVCEEMDRVLGETGEATDEACEAALGGWRQSLQLSGLTVPSSCAEVTAPAAAPPATAEE